MAAMLQAVIDDPSPGPSVTSGARGGRTPDDRPEDVRAAEMRGRLLSGYDRVGGGWSPEHKFLDADNVEYCLRAASRGDADAAATARDMLRLQRQLLDPAWGGVYQYSAEGDWIEPHFERIMSVQADNLRIYSMAASQWPGWGYDEAARGIARYLRDFLGGADGAFCTSQDADLVPGEHAAGYFSLGDRERRARGLPRVDAHRYSRENGWAICALCALHGATGDPDPLKSALGAADWVVGHRAIPGGGFRHDEADAAGPFLGDTLSMGAAFLALYQATGDSAWLARAEGAADFVRAHFGRGPSRATPLRHHGGVVPGSIAGIRRVNGARPLREPSWARVGAPNRPCPGRVVAAVGAVARERGRPGLLRRGPPARDGRGSRGAAPRHHRRAKGRRGRPRHARRGASGAHGVQARGMVGPARGAAAARRVDIPRPREARGVPLRQRGLLVADTRRRGPFPQAGEDFGG